MKKEVSQLLITVFLTSVPAVAQELEVTSRPVEGIEPAAIESFRYQLLNLSDAYSTLATKPETQRIVDDFVLQVEQVSDEDLAFLVTSGVDFSELLWATMRIEAMPVTRIKLVDSERQSNKSRDFPKADYPVICGSQRPNPDAVLSARIALQIAKGVLSGFSRTCNQTAFGFNTSLACLIPDAVFYVAEAILMDLTICRDSINSAEIKASYERLGHIHDDIEELLSHQGDGFKSLDCAIGKMQ